MIIKKIKCLLLVACLTLLTLTSCASDSNFDMESTSLYVADTESNETYQYFDDLTLSSQEKLIYSIYEQALGVYDMEDNTWKKLYEEDVFAYQIAGEKEVYTIGSSGENYFSIIKDEGNRVIKLLDIDNEDSLMPFGSSGSDYYFIYNMDDLGSDETRKIVKYNLESGEITDVTSVGSELLITAVLQENVIYYTAYHPDEDTYYLYCYDIEGESTETIRTDLETDHIYDYHGEIVYINSEGNLMNLDDESLYSFMAGVDYDYIPDYGVMIQVYINNKADISCEVIDIASSEIIASADKYVGYEIEKGNLVLYCEGGISQVPLDN